MISHGGMTAEESAALLQLLYVCPVAIVKFDSSGAIDLMNPLGAQLLMPVAPDAKLDNLFDTLAGVAPEVQEMVQRFRRVAGRICDEHRVIVSVVSGATSHTSILSLTIQRVDRDAYVAVIGDVTAAALRERVVRTSEARLRAVFDGVRDYGICTVDLNGKITSWNPAAERMEGFRADDVIGMSADVLMPGAGSGRDSIAPFLRSAKLNGWHEFDSWRIRKDGSRFWANSIISMLRGGADGDELIGFSIVTRDLTQGKRSEDQLRLIASTDPLTGVYNRRAFYDAAIRAETRFRNNRVPVSILLLDLDHFKLVNDSHGHEAGDELLRHFVAIVYGEIRATDVVGRQGGEEFLVLLPESDGDEALQIAQRIRARCAASPMPYGAAAITVTVSIGVAQLGVAARDIASLVRAADAALYKVKAGGRNGVMRADPAAG